MFRMSGSFGVKNIESGEYFDNTENILDLTEYRVQMKSFDEERKQNSGWTKGNECNVWKKRNLEICNVYSRGL